MLDLLASTFDDGIVYARFIGAIQAVADTVQ